MKPKCNNCETEIIQFSLRLPKELNDFLVTEAKQKGLSKQAVIVSNLWELKNNIIGMRANENN